MVKRRGAGNQQNIGRALEQPGQGYLHRRDLKSGGDLIEHRRLQWREASQGEEWNVGDALPGERIDEGIILAIGYIVEILDADDLGDFLSLRELLGSDVAEADVTNQTLALHVHELAERLYDRAFRRLQLAADAQVDDFEMIET